jgi:predicted deacylase
MTRDAFAIADLKVPAGHKAFTRLPVTTLLVGADLTVPLHVLHGAKDGPVLGLISGIHGREHFVMRIVREVLLSLNLADLAGTIVAIPVANPMAFARDKRSTPEEDIDFADMNRIFPGVRAQPVFGGGESPLSDRSLTERVASTISKHFFPVLDYMVDFHCHFAGCSLVESIVKTGDSPEANQTSFEMNRLLNTGVMHGANGAKPITATGYASTLGVITAVLEIGGAGLSGSVQARAVAHGAEGVLNILRYLDMIPGEIKQPGRQLYGSWQPHVRPTVAGYLLTEFPPDALFDEMPFGIPVREGDLLGTVFDPYSFKVVEELHSPADGVLYLCRISGPVKPGSHAYAVCAYEGARWVD